MIPSSAGVVTHLEEICRSRAFAASPKLREFLRYVVFETLAGHTNGLKEYAVAASVYGRGEDYDPQVDSTVRVEAGRLRRKLQSFYETECRSSGLRIEIPKGTYVPVFHWAAAARSVA